MRWLKKNKFDMICCKVSIFIFCLNKGFLIKNYKGDIGYFFKCYLNDLMAPLFVLAISSMLLRWAGYETVKFWIIMIIGMFAAVIWEFVIPFVKMNSVMDVFDLFCYFVGTIVYYGIREFVSKLKNN